MSQPPMIGYAALGDFHTPSLRRRYFTAILRLAKALGLGVLVLVAFVITFQLIRVGVLAGIIALIACVVVTSVAAGCVRAARRQRAVAVLSYCEQGVRLAMPLPEFLRAVAMNESPQMAQRLLSIVQTLEAPAPLGGAVRSDLPELPRRYGEILRAAEQNGTLAPTLTRLIREERPPSVDAVAGEPIPLAYFALMLVGLILPITFIAVFALPRMSALFRDFGIPLPAYMSVWQSFNSGYMLLALILTTIVAAILLLGVLGRNARWIFFRTLEHDRPLKPVADRVKWYLPVIGAQTRDRDLADVCQMIADGLEEHRPLEATIRAAASPHLNEVTLARLEAWHGRLLAGGSIAAAARAARLPGLITGLIGGGSEVSGSLAPTFAFLARHYRSRALERGAWLHAAALPVLTLVAGGIVTAFALSLWLPLCHLIDVTLPYQAEL